MGDLLRFGVFYAAWGGTLGAHVPFFPVWLADRGLSEAAVGAIIAAATLSRTVLAPLAGMSADAIGDRRRIVLGFAVLATALYLALAVSPWLALVTFLAVAGPSAFGAVEPTADAHIFRSAQDRGLDFGRMRLWASVAFIAGNGLSGALIEGYGPQTVVWWMVCGAALTALAASTMPLAPRPIATPIPFAAALNAIALEARALAGRPLFLLFLLAAGSIQGAHGFFYAFGGIHWTASGLSGETIGLLWGWGVVSEVALFAFSNRAAAALGPAGLLILGGAASVIRWTVFGLDPPLPVLAAAQALHGITYGATHLGALHFIARAAPPHLAATAQSLYTMIAAGVVMSGVSVLGGFVYPQFGGAFFIGMAGLSALGLAASVLLARRWPGGRLDIPAEAA